MVVDKSLKVMSLIFIKTLYTILLIIAKMLLSLCMMPFLTGIMVMSILELCGVGLINKNEKLLYTHTMFLDAVSYSSRGLS